MCQELMLHFTPDAKAGCLIAQHGPFLFQVYKHWDNAALGWPALSVVACDPQYSFCKYMTCETHFYLWDMDEVQALCRDFLQLNLNRDCTEGYLQPTELLQLNMYPYLRLWLEGGQKDLSPLEPYFAREREFRRLRGAVSDGYPLPQEQCALPDMADQAERDAREQAAAYAAMQQYHSES